MIQKTSDSTERVEKVKVLVKDLLLGMYVFELDRPWLDSPFLFQGFILEAPEDIDAVRSCCEYVYIDLLRTDTARFKQSVSLSVPETLPPAQKTTPFGKEIQAAETATKQTSKLMRTFVDDIRFGASVDIQIAKDAVSDCVASILRNSDAMMFMTRMRQKSDQLSQHAMDSCIYAILVGRLMGLDPQQLEDLGTCGLVHDLGKVVVPDEILNKPGALTPKELAMARDHVRLGRDILISGRKIFSGTVDVAYNHHENLDGSGYPRGLKAEALNLNCRIVSVVEKYDALVNQRPYRPPYTHLDALNFLNNSVKKNRLDREVVMHFVSYLGFYPPGSIIELSNGEKAIVLETNPKQRMRPSILIVRDREDAPIVRFVDMATEPTDPHGHPYKITAVHRPNTFGINLLDYRDTLLKN